MLKTWEKFTFVFVVIAMAFFARAAYPTQQLSNGPDTFMGSGTADASHFLAVQSADSPSAADGQNSNSGTNTEESSFIKSGSAKSPAFAQEASLVADLDRRVTFTATNPDTRWPTASLTKLMTATIVLDAMDPNTRITITPDMMATDPDETTLVVGGSYSVNDLLHLMLMPSSNVAAEALADFYGRARFMDEMNSRAIKLRMKNTYFDDPSGISAANQSTANDLLLLAETAYSKYPNLLTITRTPSYQITDFSSGKSALIKSINMFAGESEFIGGKTGHTNEAGGNLLSIFSYKNRPLLIIVLGVTDRFGDTVKLYNWFKANYH